MPDTFENAYEYFKATREQRGLSIADIANVLHLNVTVIEQIEAGDFSNRRFAPVFMRGYIRSYAKYLQLPDEITQKIVSTLDITDTPPAIIQKIQTTPEKRPSIKRIKKIIAYIVVVILLIIVASFWHSLDKPATQQVTDNSTTQEPINLSVENTETITPTTDQESTSVASEENTIPLTEDSPTPSTQDLAEAPAQEEAPGPETMSTTTPETTPVAPEENSSSITAPLPPVVKTPVKPADPLPTNTSTTPVIDAQETP